MSASSNKQTAIDFLTAISNLIDATRGRPLEPIS